MWLPILGMGTAVPEFEMLQEEAAEMAAAMCGSDVRSAKLAKALYGKAGVKTRRTVVPHRTAYQWLDEDPTLNVEPTDGPTTGERMALYEMQAPPLAEASARRALEDAGIEADRITHLVTVTCTGFFAPGFDFHLFNTLGLKPTVERVQVGFMGCHGAMNGLKVARAIGLSDPDARILVCATELCSLHYRFRWDPQFVMGNVLFADGSASVVLGGREESEWNLLSTGSCVLPDSADAMTWRVGDHGFVMTLDATVPDRIRSGLRPWIDQWLAKSGHSVAGIKSWAIHPGGPRIVSAAEEVLELPRDATNVSREILSEYGNMSSPTALFILEKMRREGHPQPCLALGFGPGLAAEAALFGPASHSGNGKSH